MGKTLRTRDTLYLDTEKFALLEKLAKETRIPRAELCREAIDDLLIKYKVLKAPRRKP
jgi:Ribbon-helix-helix domain